MAFAETANLAVKLTLGGNFNSQLAKTRAGLRGFDKDASRAYKAGGQIGTGIKRSAVIAAAGVGALVSQIGFGLDSLIQLESATAQTNAVIKSTGGVAAQTSDDVRRLAEQYESLNATIDDKVIQSGQNLLLTFTNIRGKAFEPTLAAALDMNQALGGGPEGLQSVMMKLGKAMNSPAEGFTALKRSGVLFNKEQQAILKGSDNLDKKELKVYNALKKRNKAEAERYKQGVLRVKLEAAQALILKELGVEFGGSFAKAGDTTAGSVAKFGDAIEDLQKSLATALLPTVRNIADSLTELLADPAVIRGAKDLGASIGELFSKDNIKSGIGAIKSAMEAIRSIAGPVADVIRTAVGAFTSLPPDIQKLLVAGFAVNKLTGGLVTNIAGGIFGALKAMTVRASIVNVSGGVVNGGGAGGPGVVGGGTSKLVKGLAGLSILADIGAVIATQQAVSGESSAQAQAVTETARVYLASSPTTDQLAMSLAAVDTGIDRLQSNPLYVLVQGSALDELRKTRAAIVAQIAAQGSANGSEDRPMNSPTPVVKNTSKTVSAVEAAKAAIAVASKLAAAKAAAQQAKLEATRQAINIGSSSAKSSAGNIASRVSAAGAATASALRNLPVPIVTTTVNVSVTASGISKTVTTQSRYGPATGSSSGDPRFLGYTPGL
jgi:hypothetical protein